MNSITTLRFPNLFDLIMSQTGPRRFSLPAVALTYVLLPLFITVAIIATGVVLPGSIVAAVFLFLAIAYSNGLIAYALAFSLPRAGSKIRSQILVCVSSLFPFAVWYITVITRFGY